MSYSVLDVAFDGVFCDAVGEAHDGYFCEVAVERPRPGGGRRPRYRIGDEVDWEKYRERTRVLRDQKDLRDLAGIIELLQRGLTP